jgi:hypothetical protein
MAQVNLQTAGNIISQNIAAAATVTVTLLTPAAGQCNLIKAISCYGAAATAADVHITKSDATSIARIGGAGIGILAQPLVFAGTNQPRGGISGYTADASLVVLTTTAGTTTECSVVYEQVPT